MSTQEVPRRPKNFEEFYRADYRSLMRDVIFAGGKPHEAEDVISTAMIEVLQRWESIKNPRAYAAAARCWLRNANLSWSSRDTL